MKKVSVTNKYTYDGKEMTERDIEMYKVGRKDNETPYFLIFALLAMGVIAGYFSCQFLNH